jgi:AcrR family transcriptional regulator
VVGRAGAQGAARALHAGASLTTFKAGRSVALRQYWSPLQKRARSKSREAAITDVRIPDDLVDETPLGRREAGKQERRRRIIEAARALIRETGNAGLSMRALAARAGVSLATPYNLFGSKHAIILAVLEDVRAYEERFAASRVTDPVERMFMALELALEFYLSDPRFYKTLWSAVFETDAEIRSDVFNPRRSAFWRGLIADAITGGAIEPDVDPAMLQQQFDLLLRSGMHGWVTGELSHERLGLTMAYGFSLMLCGAATPAWRASLRARLLESQARLLKAPARPRAV